VTATIAERFDSRPSTSGDSPGIDLIYIVRDTEDEAAVRALAQSAAPETYEDLDLLSISTEPQGGGLWYPTVMIRDRLLHHPNRCQRNPTLTHNRTPTSANQLSHRSIRLMSFRSTHPIRFRFRFPTIRYPAPNPSPAVPKTHSPPATTYRHPNHLTIRRILMTSQSMTARVSTDPNRSFRHLNLATATPPKSLAAFMDLAAIPAS